MKSRLPTWSVYKLMELDERERIHLAWCKKHSKDPDSEEHVNEFFDEMATVPEPDPLNPPKPKGRPRKVDQLVAK